MSNLDLRFEPAQMPAGTEALRAEVRAFLADMRARGIYRLGPAGWAEVNRPFCIELGKRGWLGMTWPKKYGGHERSAMERYVVTEELLANGAPIRALQAADRQNGPLILHYGTEWQKQTFLPKFASGEASCAIGLSEPDSGSDLAGIRTRAVRVEGGWKVNGRKVWTSSAHYSQYMTLLARTGENGGERHAGMTRFLIDLSWPGIIIRPIYHMTGEYDFNEVIYDDVFVPDSMLIGEVDQAWKQLTMELAHERSSPDRWTAQLHVLAKLLDELDEGDDRLAMQSVGRLVSHLWTLRNMSASVASMLGRGLNPSIEASIVKDLGTHYEQDIPHVARLLVDEGERAALPEDNDLTRILKYNLLFAPALTIRGGTREMLRNNIARGLGLR